MVLDPFGIQFGHVLGHTDRHEKQHNRAVPPLDPVRKGCPRFGQEHAAIGA